MTVMALKLELTQSLRSAMHELVERLLDVSDYFIFQKKVSASEGLLFSLCAIRTAWYLIYGISTDAGVIAYVFPNMVWTFVFTLLTIAHIGSMFSPSGYSRGLVCVLYAVVWTFLAVLTLWAPFNSPAGPTFFVFGLTSAFVAARLIRESYRIPRVRELNGS